MADIITEYGLLQRNIGKEYTYEKMVDRTNTDMQPRIHDGRVNKSLNFSDHNIISYNIAAEILELPATRPWAKADWYLQSGCTSKHYITVKVN